MRATARVAVFVCLGLVMVATGAVAADLVVERDGGVTSLRQGDAAPFHVTTAAVEAPRLIDVGDGATTVAVWDEIAPDGARTPFYALGLGGAPLGSGRATSYVLGLRHGSFDPLAGVPAVESDLAADDTGRLFVVQFETQPLTAYRDRIAAAGGEVVGYLPGHAHVVRMPAAARDRVRALPFVRWVGPYHPAYRLEEALRSGAGSLPGDKRRYSVLLFDASAEAKGRLAAWIEGIGGAVDSPDAGKFRIEATLAPAQLYALARRDEVEFIDRWSPLERDMDIVRETGGANYVESVAGYTGQGVRGESFDAGFNANHPDFVSRPPLIHGGPIGLDSHGTATYGICFGDGTGDARARGLLPDGQGIMADYNNVGLTGANRYTHTGELREAPYFAVFQTASVGSARTTEYTTISADHDTLLFDWDVLHCQSQSNAGNQDSRPQAWAKNVVSGGAFNHYDTPSRDDDCWCNSGSIGPASDGRIKPDLSFFYDSTYTTYTTGSGYGEFGGTSGATPSICGHFGLFFQMWSDGIFGNEVDPAGTVFDNRPHMTTAKATLINTASQYPFSGTAHDLTRVHQGWGVPDVRALYDLRDRISFVDESVLLGNTETAQFNVFVDPGTPALRVTMTYADPAGNPAASVHRVNDLTLHVVAPSGTEYWGNVGLLEGNWSVPGGSPNTIDTVENVFVENPADGLWTVEVIASEINQDGHVETPALDADFALVVSGGVLNTCTSDGVISLSGAKYACEDTATIRVVDCDLNTDDTTVQTVAVTIDSTSEPGGETVVLTETDPASATFRASIPLSVVDGAGVLQVADGDLVTATYVDADDGLGGTDVVKTDQAIVDCVPPVISNVATSDVQPRSATVTFDTDEPANGSVRYGTSCANLSATASEAGYPTAHSVRLTGLQDATTYHYAVDAVDEVGNAATDDNGGACYTFTTPEIPDFFTELFDAADNDTDFTRLTFTPNGSTDFYAGCADAIATLPTDPSGGTPVTLTDDDFEVVTLTGGRTVSLYGVAYDTFYIGSNGFVTFTAGDTDTSESIVDHFDLPRISALFDDLNPAAGGAVTWQQFADRAVVTFSAVPEYSTSNANTFQIEMFFDGTIAISFLDVAATDGLAGLSAGGGVPADFFETDLSSLAACYPAHCSDGVQNSGEERIDCGGPCAPCQCTSDAACDDGLFCTGVESCDPFGACATTGDPCPGLECDEAGDRCLGCDMDGICELGENCMNCPTDCISGSAPVCGDGLCQAADGEDCLSCPSDCNGAQSGNPGNRFCCGDGTVGEGPVTCADARCTAGGNTCEANTVLAYCCGDATCDSPETIGTCAPDCTPPVPGEAGSGAMLLVTGVDRVAGTIALSWGVPCSAADHTIEYGELTPANLAAHAWSGQECAVGATGTYTWDLAGTPDAMFFVVVGNNGTEEGSYGRDSAGVERSEDATSSVCPMPQNLPYACQ